jgi:hypothetical protein
MARMTKAAAKKRLMEAKTKLAKCLVAGHLSIASYQSCEKSIDMAIRKLK